MSNLKLISTDFDGTLFAEFENPPIPASLQQLLGDLQQRGAKWVINTGREMASLMEALARAGVEVEPDYLILVEREIYSHQQAQYVSVEPWNTRCTQVHKQLFAAIRPDLPRIIKWIQGRFHAHIYEDPFSPFCLVASNTSDMDVIHQYLEQYSRTIPGLTVVRNDVYSRFCHVDYNKGTALAELSRRLNVQPAEIFTAGDHFNDLPMLFQKFAQCLAAPANAVAPVQMQVRHQGGYVSPLSHGHGVADAIKYYLARASA
jgi:hydroxymethylpyrimidine pyrophosphatase-like HAD family hydrolase